MKKFYIVILLMVAFVAGVFVSQVTERKIAAREKRSGSVRCVQVRHDVSEKEFDTLVTHWAQAENSEIDYSMRQDGYFTVTQITPAINGMCLE